MAKLKNPLLGLRASGSLSKVITFLRRGKVDLVEKKPEIKDAETPAQVLWRTMFTACKDLWHTLSAAEKAVWESQGTARHMTGYAWYMSQCLRPNPGIYLPLAGGTMAGDIDMDSNLVTGLPAPTQAHHATRKSYVDALDRGEGHTIILGNSYSAIGQGVWHFSIVATDFLNGRWENSSGADGDNISYKVYLVKGTYTLGLLYIKSTDRGILDFDIDAVEVASFDQYAAGLSRNHWSTQADIAIASAGLKTLKARVDGKHGSSTDHIISIQYIALWRTA